MSINREGFMTIMGNVWASWAPPEKIINAAKRVGISSHDGLDVNWMQQDKFETAARLMTPPVSESLQTSAIESPQDLRKGSAAYWKSKYESLKDANSPNEINIEEVPGFMPINIVKPKKDQEKLTRATLVHGSLHGTEILKIVKEIKQKKVDAEEKKEKKKEDQLNLIERFIRCKDQCVCLQVPCMAAGLKRCTICHNVLKSNCTKSSCRGESGEKPKMECVVVPISSKAVTKGKITLPAKLLSAQKTTVMMAWNVWKTVLMMKKMRCPEMPTKKKRKTKRETWRRATT